MKKYFTLLLNLLEIQNQDCFDQVLEIIEKHKTKKIHFYHQYGFLLQWYLSLLQEKISLEDFLKIWDIDSPFSIDIQKKDSISFLRSNPKLISSEIYIFDSLAQWIIAKQNNVFYC